METTLPEKMTAIWEPDDNDEICGECGEAPKDCKGHTEEEMTAEEPTA